MTFDGREYIKRDSVGPGRNWSGAYFYEELAWC